MPQEPVAKSCSFRSSLDQTRNIGDDKGPEIAHIDDAEIRFERGERVIGDLGPCGRDDRDQSRFTRVWVAYQTNVGDQLQLELQLSFLSGSPRVVIFWSPCGRRRKMSVAPAAFSAFRR